MRESWTKTKKSIESDKLFVAIDKWPSTSCLEGYDIILLLCDEILQVH